MKVNKELKQANEKLKEISHDEHMQKIAEWRYKAILEENTLIIIQKMLENGSTIDKIQLSSGYSIENIEKIKKI